MFVFLVFVSCFCFSFFRLCLFVLFLFCCWIVFGVVLVLFSFFCFLFCFFLFFGRFKGQVRWPKGPPHLALSPPYCLLFFVVLRV